MGGLFNVVIYDDVIWEVVYTYSHPPKRVSSFCFSIVKLIVLMGRRFQVQRKDQ